MARSPYHRFGMMAALMATTARSPLMRASQAPEEGAPAADPTIQAEGNTLRHTPPVQETGPEAPKPGGDAPAGDRPAAWPEGVNSWEEFGKLSPEDQAKAYAPKGDEADATKIETKGTENEPPKEGIDLQVAETLKQLGPEFGAKAEPFVRELATTGDLSAESVTKAAAALGLPKALVTQYVADRKAEAASADAAVVAPVYELVGGKENYPAFQAWASEALGPDDQAKINAALGLSADGSKAEGAIDTAALKAYTDAFAASGRGAPPRDITAEAAPAAQTEAAATDVYASREEMTRDMGTPLYKRDPAERARVAAKLGRSTAI